MFTTIFTIGFVPTKVMNAIDLRTQNIRSLPNVLYYNFSTHFDAIISKYYPNYLDNAPNLELEISHLRMGKIEVLRKAAISSIHSKGNTTITKKYKATVKAIIRYNKKNIPVKIRLKGISLTHYLSPKFSLRITALDNNTIMGMKEFSVTDPNRKAVLMNWLLNLSLRNENLISLRNPLIHFSINGEQKGLYAVEEIPSSEIFADNKLREGVIVLFDDSVFEDQDGLTFPRFGDAFLGSKAKVFRPKNYMQKSLSRKQAIVAVNMLVLLKEGRVQVDEIFDIPKFATWTALYSVFNGYHGFTWDSMRLYYNPITSKLEPIIWDAFNENQVETMGRMLLFGEHTNQLWYAYIQKIVSNYEFIYHYTKELDRIVSHAYIESFFNKYKKEINEYVNIVVADNPLYNIKRDLDLLHKNVDIFRKKYFNNIEDALEIKSATIKHNEITIILKNTKIMPIAIKNVSFKNKTLNLSGKLPIFLSNANPLPINKYKAIVVSPLSFALNEEIINNALTIDYVIWGTDISGSTQVVIKSI